MEEDTSWVVPEMALGPETWGNPLVSGALTLLIGKGIKSTGLLRQGTEDV